MKSEGGGRFSARFETWLACAVVLVVGWQAVAGLVFVVHGLARPSASLRRAALLAERDERFERTLGDDFGAWSAVTELVPSDSRLIVAYAKRSRGPLQYLRLRTMLYPLELTHHTHDPRAPSAIGLGEEEGWEAFVLDLASGMDLATVAGARELARGPSFGLWQLVGQGESR